MSRARTVAIPTPTSLNGTTTVASKLAVRVEPFSLLIAPLVLGPTGLAVAVGINRWLARLFADRRRQNARPSDQRESGQSLAERPLEAAFRR
jgi:hypothetical protein